MPIVLVKCSAGDYLETLRPLNSSNELIEDPEYFEIAGHRLLHSDTNWAYVASLLAIVDETKVADCLIAPVLSILSDSKSLLADIGMSKALDRPEILKWKIDNGVVVAEDPPYHLGRAED